MRVRQVLLLTILPTVVALGAPARGSVGVRNAPGIRIIPPEEVLRDYVHASGDGGLWFTHPGGAGAPLVLSTDHPEIQNPGDGSFHPANLDEVVRAVEMLPASLIEELEIQVFLLPFPRSGLLSSSADDHGIYITPGVHEYTAAQVQFLVAHELGHSYHRAYLPDSESPEWEQYRELRGITDRDRFGAGADHAFRPHEIFAEDFRVLFAGALGRGDGNVENREIARPDAVPGLSSFLTALSGAETASIEWIAYPNPLHRGDQLRLRGGDLEIADAILIDVAGRQVASFPLRPGGVGEWRVPSSELERLESGAYWLRLSGKRSTLTVPFRWIR